VLPSFAEGLPVVIMEAMALRRPVLATYIAGIPELVRPMETGWLFPAGSVADLAQAMEDCLAAPAAELQRMGEAALRRVAARHAIENSNLATLFRAPDLAADRPASAPSQVLPASLALHQRLAPSIPPYAHLR
jgi:glycosyltransferase involved in cell wall biosynthesis